ncbi:RNA polymerase sigma factor [Pontibacter toksunensis]|uniref:RNA polymerase sigma factor n=1 Tax=Pontibacter toksunensis TaxID=1332631 RepID=A0ABW6BZK2_9BACT
MPGNPEEFLSLLKPHYRDALQYCRALCRDPHEAQDLLQQSLVSALEKASHLREPDKFKSWYFKIITRTFYTQRRKKFWSRFLPLGPPYQELPLPAVFEEEPGNERQALLLLALQELKPKERAAILLFEIGEFSIQEIADIQEEKSLSAVKSRLSRTRQKLKTSVIDAEKKRSLTPMLTGDLNHETEKLAAAYLGRR